MTSHSPTLLVAYTKNFCATKEISLATGTFYCAYTHIHSTVLTLCKLSEKEMYLPTHCPIYHYRRMTVVTQILLVLNKRYAGLTSPLPISRCALTVVFLKETTEVCSRLSTICSSGLSQKLPDLSLQT